MFKKRVIGTLGEGVALAGIIVAVVTDAEQNYICSGI